MWWLQGVFIGLDQIVIGFKFWQFLCLCVGGEDDMFGCEFFGVFVGFDGNFVFGRQCCFVYYNGYFVFFQQVFYVVG